MTSLADITGAGTTVPITLTAPARFVLFSVTGSGTARVGGSSSVSATNGTAVPAGAVPVVFPPCGEFFRYQKTELYAYIPSGATLQVAFKEVSVP